MTTQSVCATNNNKHDYGMLHVFIYRGVCRSKKGEMQLFHTPCGTLYTSDVPYLHLIDYDKDDMQYVTTSELLQGQA